MGGSILSQSLSFFISAFQKQLFRDVFFKQMGPHGMLALPLTPTDLSFGMFLGIPWCNVCCMLIENKDTFRSNVLFKSSPELEVALTEPHLNPSGMLPASSLHSCNCLKQQAAAVRGDLFRSALLVLKGREMFAVPSS